MAHIQSAWSGKEKFVLDLRGCCAAEDVYPQLLHSNVITYQSPFSDPGTFIVRVIVRGEKMV